MQNLKYNFEGRCAVVTGGAQGIGFEISKRFLEAGCAVSVWDYSAEGLEAAKRELSSFDKLHTAQVDVGSAESCAKAASELPFKAHVVVNNAGITRDKSFSKMTAEMWDSVIRTNLTGLFHVTQTMLPHFDESDSNKRIINMASVVALYGNFGQTNYVAAKSGVIGMTKTWAKELGRKGFTVNAIAPGFIETAMTQKMPEDVLAGMKSKVPNGSLGQTADIANACLFLASSEAGYINGHTLSVDGALSM